MNTAFILMAQYQTAIIPAERVAKDYFQLTADKFIRKALAGDIPLPLVRMEASQKSARGVHLADLAAYLVTAAGNRSSGTRTWTRWATSGRAGRGWM